MCKRPINLIKPELTLFNSFHRRRDDALLGNLTLADRKTAAQSGTQRGYREINVFAPLESHFPSHLMSEDLIVRVTFAPTTNHLINNDDGTAYTGTSVGIADCKLVYEAVRLTDPEESLQSQELDTLNEQADVVGYARKIVRPITKPGTVVAASDTELSQKMSFNSPLRSVVAVFQRQSNLNINTHAPYVFEEWTSWEMEGHSQPIVRLRSFAFQMVGTSRLYAFPFLTLTQPNSACIHNGSRSCPRSSVSHRTYIRASVFGPKTRLATGDI